MKAGQQLISDGAREQHLCAAAWATAADPWPVVEHDPRNVCERPSHRLPVTHIAAETGLKDNWRSGAPQPFERDLGVTYGQ